MSNSKPLFVQAGVPGWLSAIAMSSLLSACGGGSAGPSASTLSSAGPSARALGATDSAAATLTVQNEVIGSTPAVLAYNVAHAMVGSNALDWMRYSGVKAVRVFVNPADIEASDDIAGDGDGVSDQASFDARRALLRANAADPTQTLDPQYIDWAKFEAGYDSLGSGNNRFVVNQFFPQLRSLGIEILINLNAAPARFPLADNGDYANIWELWQHYYAQAYKLSRDFDVRRYGIFNEPNNFIPKPTVQNWELRLRICSDAIQSAIADVNARYGKNLRPEVFAPNTAGGRSKYNNSGDTWGQQAVLNRHKNPWDLDLGSSWLNFQVYNYQKYSMYAQDTVVNGMLKNGLADEFDQLKAKIAADLGEAPMLPMAQTEMNVRTGNDYDKLSFNADTPSDYAALAANSIALAQDRLQQLYLFKFGMTPRAASTTSPTVYVVQKNGTHYVSNFSGASDVNNYGGAAGTAEVWRLFVKASGQGRPRLAYSSSLGADVLTQVTRDPLGKVVYVYIANKGLSPANIDIDLSALGLAEGSLATVEDVNTAARGAVSLQAALTGGRVTVGEMPAQSVRLVSIYGNAVTAPSLLTASADASLRDGTGKNTTSGGQATVMEVRADGTRNARRVVLIRFDVPSDWSGTERVLLALNAGSTTGSELTQAHVYGLSDNSWTEATPWTGMSSALKQGVPSGKLIANNVVANAGSTTQILGQLLVNSDVRSEKLIDVSDFVRSQTGGQVSFLVVQEHRWDKPLNEKSEDPTGNQISSSKILWSGDVQAAGIAISARESGSGPVLKLFPR